MTDEPEFYKYEIEIRLGVQYTYRNDVLIDVRSTTLDMVVTNPNSFIPEIYIPKSKDD